MKNSTALLIIKFNVQISKFKVNNSTALLIIKFNVQNSKFKVKKFKVKK